MRLVYLSRLWWYRRKCYSIEYIHFYYVAILTLPRVLNPCLRGHAFYKLGRQFYEYSFSLSPTTEEVNKN